MAINKRQLKILNRRRMTDIERVGQQYRKNFESLNNDFSSAYADYQRQTGAVMDNYQSVINQYRTETYPAFEKQLAAYQSRLDAHAALIQDAIAEPLREVPVVSRTTQGSSYVPARTELQIDGKWYAPNKIPEGYTYEKKKLYQKKDVGTFTEEAPTPPPAPAAPPAPPKFDTKPFDDRREQLTMEFGREVAERKAGRRSAVSRRATRPLMQGK